MWQSSAKRWAM